MKICTSCSEPYTDDAAFCPNDGAELKRSPDPYLGRTLAARYRLIKRLGSGGMSVVYLARHVMIERMSAIKILRQDLGMSPTHRERFLREARAVNRINHDNIVEITDYGEADGLTYLVMEYVDGESLLAHLKRGRFTWQRAVRITTQVSAALARAHQAGVIHRDLKPENILLIPNGDDDRVKLTDFGIAKMVDAPALTFSEQLFGTPGYIAPEYVEGIAGDGRADIYSLGVVLYEMLTGSLPYNARSQADLLLLPLSTAPVPPSTRVDGLPADLESLVLKMLARRAEARPADAFQIRDTLVDIARRFANPSRRPPPSSGNEAAVVDRPSLPTVAGARASSVPASIGQQVTAIAERLPTMNLASRWVGAISEVDESIARARQRGGREAEAAVRATELADEARVTLTKIERAASAVSEHQARVDRLDATGREFRGNLGFALDQLSHDRSRERAHAEALRARRASLEDERSFAPERAREALLWEGAALAEEEERAAAIERDLTFQIGTLTDRLERQNEELENELVKASGTLEGSLAALRSLTSELVRLIDQATKLVTI
jgi:serine/threonine protein kinase